jgi:hypothetical protein
MTPARTRAMRIPSSKPEKTIDIADARLDGGARSAARGIRICGAKLVVPMKKQSVLKTTSDRVTARPMVKLVLIEQRSRRRGRRFTRSPRGLMRRSPEA